MAMKKLVPLLVCLLLGGQAFAQTFDWKKKYDVVKPFCEVFIVRKGEKMGLVDPSGKPVTRLVFDDIDELDQGYAQARIDGHNVFLHESGGIGGSRPYHEVLEDWIKPPLNDKHLPAWAKNYVQVTPTAGVFIVRKFTVAQEKVIRGQRKIFRTEMAGLVDASGRPLTGLVYDGIWPFTDGRAMVRQKQEYGFLDSTGWEVIPVKYEYATSFSEGVAVANGWLIDRNGRKRFSTQKGYSGWGGFSGNLCQVSIESAELPGAYEDLARPHWGRYNYIDHAGNFQIPARYDSIWYDVPGEMRVVWKDGRGGLLDVLARERVSPRFQEIETEVNFPDLVGDSPGRYGLRYGWPHHRRVKLAGRYGFLDLTTGRLAIPCRYQTTLPNEEGRIWVKESGKWGLLDSAGREILPPSLAFDTVHSFREGRALVRQGYRFGYVDPSGRLVIPLRYWQADDFRRGLASARTWLRRGLLRPDGTWFRSAVAAEWLLMLMLLGLAGGLWALRRWWVA